MELSPLAQDLQTLRYRAGLDQQALADALGMSQAKISLYETGKQRPKPARYRRMVEYLEAVISGDDSRAQAIAERAA